MQFDLLLIFNEPISLFFVCFAILITPHFVYLRFLKTWNTFPIEIKWDACRHTIVERNLKCKT